MKHLSIDLETRSTRDLGKSGVYAYAADPSFTILLFAYSIDGSPVRVVDVAQGEPIPHDILKALDDPGVAKHAWNANFERICLSAHLGKKLAPQGWYCTMVHAATLGLPLALKDAAQVLSLDVQKMTEGTRLIRSFSTPDKNGSFTKPADDPEGWLMFKSYNARDVEVEHALQTRFARFPVLDAVWEEYWLDQTINDRGVKLDLNLATQAIQADRSHRETCLAQAQTLTGLENPNSPLQLKDWLATNGCKIESLAKADVDEAQNSATGAVKEVLKLRQELSRSSVKKYEAMTIAAGTDDRARGLMQFYGANRTGRWAGRLIQVQNLPRNYLPDLDQARTLIKNGHADVVPVLFGSLPDTLSQLIRTAFIPSENHRFIVADFSAIEARVIAWLAGERWILDAFRAGHDIYCETASQMFGVPVEKHGANSELRQKGKIATLACGYSGSTGALTAMGALRMGLDESELKPIVDAWRQANPRIVQLWWDIEAAAMQAIEKRTKTTLGNLAFECASGMLRITLPSGRTLSYVKPSIGENRFGSPSITYWGQSTGRRWTKLETYGGKLAENITQATARDLLTHAMTRLEKAGYRIVMHVHDEVICDQPLSHGSVEEACSIMSRPPAWAEGLPLSAEGFECEFYKKD